MLTGKGYPKERKSTLLLWFIVFKVSVNTKWPGFFFSFSLSFSYWTASVDFKNSYDEWCIVIQKAQDKARCLLSEYDQKFLPLKVNIINYFLCYTKRVFYAMF